MAIPDTWTQKSRRKRWTASGNVYELTQTWTGLAGVNEATYNAWLANFSGYTSLSSSTNRPGDNLNGTMEVEIGFSTNSAGEVIPPTDPNYGLVERLWSKKNRSQQRELSRHPLLKALTDVDPDWPGRVKRSVQAYNQAHREWVRSEQEALEANANAQPTAPPNMEMYIVFSTPWLKNSAGILEAHTMTSAELDLVTWLWSEYFEDLSATYDYNVPILERTDTLLTVANASLWASYANAGRILSYATLVNSEQSLELVSIINSAQLSSWSWLKGHPMTVPTSGGMYRLTQEYTGIEAPTARDLKRSGGPIL